MNKPEKPSPDFPLFAHSSGKWAKKIKGQLRYFGRWNDPAEALKQYEAFLEEHRPRSSHGYTVQDLVNEFLGVKAQARDRGTLSHRSWLEYLRTGERIVEGLGRETLVSSLGPLQFASYKKAREEHLGIVAVGNELTRVKTMFKWGHEAGKYHEKIHYGPDFKKASLKALRRHRRLQGKKLYTREQIRLILDECGVHMRAMVLLGINCGFGNTDCATLPLSAVNLETGWIEYPRPKTEVDRRIPLWPQTIKALKASLRRRYRPKPEAEKRFFVMNDGQPWDNANNPIPKHFAQIKERARVPGGFYWLRHTAQTIGDGAKDPVAVKAIMGHVDNSMSAVYREEIEDGRLRAVADYIKAWLFGK